MTDILLASLCAASIALGQGTVVAKVKVDLPLNQRVLKAQLPNYGQMFEPPGLDHWSVTIKFRSALLVLEVDGPIRWQEGQVVSLDSEVCVTPFKLSPEH